MVTSGVYESHTLVDRVRWFRVSDDDLSDNIFQQKLQDIKARFDQAVKEADGCHAKRAVALLVEHDTLDVCLERMVCEFQEVKDTRICNLLQDVRDCCSSMLGSWRQLLQDMEEAHMKQLAELQHRNSRDSGARRVTDRPDDDAKNCRADADACCRAPSEARGAEAALSLPQLQELIADVCNYKPCMANADACTLEDALMALLRRQAGASRQQMHRLLAQALAALEAHAAADAEVEVFWKALANEVEEPFLHQQRRVLPAAQAALPLLQGRQPLRSCELRHLVQHCAAAGVAAAAAAALGAPDAGPATGEAPGGLSSGQDAAEQAPASLQVSLPQLAHAAIRRNLHAHLEMLAPISAAFRRADPDGTGKLSAEGFLTFCRNLNPQLSSREARRLLAELDPHGCGLVTFSTCAGRLLRELQKLLAAGRVSAAEDAAPLTSPAVP